MMPSRPSAASARPSVAGLTFIAGQKLGDKIVDNALVVAAEFRPPPRANGFDRLVSAAGLAREVEMGGPGILSCGIAAYLEHDQFDQALVELGADAKTIRHGVGRLSDVRAVNPDRERTAKLAARPGAHDLVIERLLARAELVAFHLFDAGHPYSPV